MRSLKLPTLALTIILAAACTQDAPTTISADALSLSSASAVKMLPFRATYHFTAGLTPVPPEVCPTQLADIATGQGNATHLGRFAGETFSCVDLGNLRLTDGRFTFTAADGSQVHGTYEADLVPLSPTLIAIAGTFTITGGTGRFQGATGGGSLTGHVNLATGASMLDFDGEISSTGSRGGNR